MRLENMIWGQLKLEENQAKCRAPWCFFLLLFLFLNMLMYDLVQSVCKLFFFMKPRCFSSIRKCGKRLIFKKILQIWIWFHKKKLSLLFLLINSLTGLIYFGKVCICRRQPLHCRLLMVNACLVVWRPIIKKILKRIFFTTGWSEIFSTLGFRDAFLSMWWCLTIRKEAKRSQSHFCC